MSLFERAKKARENKKGFTLVELIVVLVILAILAAMLVPALLGWIDEARNKQYVLQARNVIIAAQTVADEAYASGNKNPKTYVETSQIAKIATIADLTAPDNGITSLTTNLVDGTEATAANHAKYTITQATLSFKVNKVDKTMYLFDGAWSDTEPADSRFTAKPVTP